MNVLVTGANGFIGRHLVQHLARSGAAVRAFVRRGSDWTERHIAGDAFLQHGLVSGDIRDRDALRTAVSECDVVVHLAAKSDASDSGDGDEDYVSVNVEGTRRLLEVCNAGGVQRVVYFSSVKAMGEESNHPSDETTAPAPVTAYGRSKLQAEQLVMEYHERRGLPGVCLRLAMVYGVGSTGNLMRMIAAVDRGIFPPIPERRNYRSVLHIDNAMSATMLAINHAAAPGKCYIVTDAEAHSTRQLYDKISRALGKSTPSWSVPLPLLRGMAIAGDAVGRIRGKRFVFDSSALDKLLLTAEYSCRRIRSELGYQPRVGLDDALPELVARYREGRA